MQTGCSYRLPKPLDGLAKPKRDPINCGHAVVLAVLSTFIASPPAGAITVMLYQAFKPLNMHSITQRKKPRIHATPNASGKASIANQLGPK